MSNLRGEQQFDKRAGDLDMLITEAHTSVHGSKQNDPKAQLLGGVDGRGLRVHCEISHRMCREFSNFRRNIGVMRCHPARLVNARRKK